MGCITELLQSGKEFVNSGASSAYVDGGGLYNGYEYLVVLTPMGHRCGYVAIPESHPLHKEDNYDGAVGYLDMHGGCTFYDKQFTDSDCTDKWIGFDCAHCGDKVDLEALQKRNSPHLDRVQKVIKIQKDYCKDFLLKFPSFIDMEHEVIRTKEFVENQCKSIIDQLNARYS